MSARRLALCVVTILHASCGGEADGLAPSDVAAIPGCESLAVSACDVRQTRCQQHLFEIASCLRGDAEQTIPTVSVITQQEYADYLRTELDPPHPDLSHFEDALVLLQLAEPGALSDDQWVDDGLAFVGGFYSSETKDIVLIDQDYSEQVEREASSVLLVHEFIHALQDRSWDLRQFRARYSTSRDSELALRALTEGEAELHQDRYMAALLGLQPSTGEWRRRFQAGVALSESASFGEASPYVSSWQLFPYAWGSRYVNLAWEAGGLAAIQELYAKPPVSSHALMASEQAVFLEPPTMATLNAPAAAAEWQEVEDWTGPLGAWGVFLAFRAGSSVATARELALGWREDSLWVYKSTIAGLPGSALVWKIEFDSNARAMLAQQKAYSFFSGSLGVSGSTLQLSSSNSRSLPWAGEE